MKNTVLLKHHPSVQLAHLYEHLFIMQANELLGQRGLFKWVDYTLNGTTYEQGGIIAVDFKSYNDDAESCLTDIQRIHLSFEESEVTKALMQLYAEEYYELKETNRESTVKQLHDIDATKWQSLDELGVLNTKDIKRKSSPLHLTNVEAKSPITTKVSLELNEKFADKNPLADAVFAIVARAILLTASYNIAKNTGSYSYSMYSQLSGKRILVDLFTSNSFRMQVPDLNEAVDEIKNTMNAMDRSGAFKRMANDLRNTSYDAGGATAPDYEQLLNDAGILVGGEGWKVVDLSLIQTVLSNIDIYIRRSKKSIRSAIVDSKN